MKLENIGIFKGVKKIADDYGPEILCGFSIISIGMMGFSAFKASRKVTEIKNEFDAKIEEAKKGENADNEVKNLKAARFFRYVLAYKYVGLFGLIAILTELGANKIQGSKIAGLTMALAASEEKIKKGCKKLKEKFGDEEFDKLRNEFFQDDVKEKLDEAPFDTDEIVPGSELFYDTYLSFMFWAPEQQIRDAIDKAGDEIKRNHRLSYNKWRGFCGLEDCPAGKDPEWNSLNPFYAEIGSMVVDGRTVKTIDYKDHMPTVKHKLK